MVVGAFGGRTSSGYLLQGWSSEPQPHCHSHKREFRRGPPSRTSMLDDLVRFEDTNKTSTRNGNIDQHVSQFGFTCCTEILYSSTPACCTIERHILSQASNAHFKHRHLHKDTHQHRRACLVVSQIPQRKRETQCYGQDKKSKRNEMKRKHTRSLRPHMICIFVQLQILILSIAYGKV